MARTTRTTHLPLRDVRDALARRPAGPTPETLRGAVRLLDRWRPTTLDSDFVCIVVGDLDPLEGPRYVFGLLDYPSGATTRDWPGDVMPGGADLGPAGFRPVATGLTAEATPEQVAASIRWAIEFYEGNPADSTHEEIVAWSRRPPGATQKP